MEVPSCSGKNCPIPPSFICFCDTGLDTFCAQHIKPHSNYFTDHKHCKLEQHRNDTSWTYLRETLKSNLATLNEVVKSIENHIKSMHSWIKTNESNISRMNENIELSKQMIEQLEHSSSNLDKFSLNNLQLLLRVSNEKLQNYFNIVYFKPELNHIPPLDMSGINQYLQSFEKLMRPILKSTNPVIQYFPSTYLTQNMDDKAVYFGATYKNELVTVKKMNFSSSLEKDLENHELAYKKYPQHFIKINYRYNDYEKYIIITEMWTHTIWNEIITRSYDNFYYNTDIITNILRSLLDIFKSESKLLHFTPNILYKTNENTYKIWYPEELDLKSKHFTYLSPKIENFSGQDLPSAQSHNIFSLGLVILQIATLKDTSLYFQESYKKESEDIMMDLPDIPLRSVLIGMLLRSVKHRFTFQKALDELNR